MVIQASAQNQIPERSDILFEISGDSLLRNNNPQDLNLSITCSSAEQVEAYILKLDEVEVLWTIVSAELNDSPLWLIMNESKSERSDILAWYYDQEDKSLSFYPPQASTNYNLNIMLRINLLKSSRIQKKMGKKISLETQTARGLERCSTNGTGNMITFR
jgi:hypothetical protein